MAGSRALKKEATAPSLDDCLFGLEPNQRAPLPQQDMLRREACCASNEQPEFEHGDWPVRARVTAALIVVALLTQAWAMVRHSAMLMAEVLPSGAISFPASAPADLMRDLLASICHPGGTGKDDVSAPGAPSQPENSQTKCPICTGLVAAVMLPPPDQLTIETLVVGKAVEFRAFDERVRTHRFIRPPSRGPPALA
jgi:hypothetical protein